VKEVRLGIVGTGGMGSAHARSIIAGKVPRMRVSAVCDLVPSKMEQFSSDILRFEKSADLIASDAVDAVLVATPHYGHTTVGIETLKGGKHLLVEKPISVHKADAQRLIAAHTDKKLVFAAMFNQRTDGYYRKVRAMIQAGELGELVRVNWVVTNWFRTQCYYESGGWRATWKGEGGGVLLNQCPHNLDLLQWLCGMPVKMRAFCNLGKRHNIEVEDEVTAYFEYANGATGVFITATGEAPGVNRLEICGDRGRLVVESGKITFYRTEVSVKQFKDETKAMFASPELWTIDVPPARGGGGQHNEILTNFADAILDGTPLVAPAAEGIHSVELATSMLLSSMTGETIDLPMDPARYEAHLMGLIARSSFEKKTESGAKPQDLASSFNTNPK
jgi:predicted dehydrogenase